MTRPVIGVIGNAYTIENRFPVQMAGERNLAAVVDVAGGLPLIFSGSPRLTDIASLLDVVDGVVLTGARANVHPSYFATEPAPEYEPYDEARDAIALPQFRAPAKRILLVGNEGAGLSPELLRLADHRVRVPVAAASDSVNVAAATAVLLYALGQT